MPDTFSVTSNESWLSRIGKAFAGIIVGLLLFLAAFPLLWWNEGRAVHRARSLAEGASVVIDVPADAVNAGNEGKLVHLTGTATTEQTLTDPDFGLSAAAIRLERHVETYQWREESSTKKRKKLGGGEETTTTYTYTKAWSASRIDSSNFHSRTGHENPASFAWESRTVTASPVTCGAFTLSPDLVSQIGHSEPRPAEAGDEPNMRERGFSAAEAGTYFKGANPSDPHIGDVRVHFEIVRPQTVSIVAVQRGTTFEAYHAQAGSDILLLREGTASAAEMFKAARAANTLTTWLLRAAGFLVMFIGLVLVVRPIAVIGSVVPLVGSILGAGTALLAFLLALALSLATIAVAWLAYRPLIGGGLIALAVGAVILLVRARRPKPVVPPPIPVGR